MQLLGIVLFGLEVPLLIATLFFLLSLICRSFFRMGFVNPIHGNWCIHKEMGWCAEVCLWKGCRLDRQFIFFKKNLFTQSKSITNDLIIVLELQNRGFSWRSTIYPTVVSTFFSDNWNENDYLIEILWIGLIWKDLNEVILLKIHPISIIHKFVNLILTRLSRPLRSRAQRKVSVD